MTVDSWMNVIRRQGQIKRMDHIPSSLKKPSVSGHLEYRLDPKKHQKV